MLVKLLGITRPVRNGDFILEFELTGLREPAQTVSVFVNVSPQGRNIRQVAEKGRELLVGRLNAVLESAQTLELDSWE